jgi:hypothetical protein
MTDDCGQTSVTKIWEISRGRLFGGAGSAGYVALVRDWLFDGAKNKTRPDCAKYEGAYFSGILICPDGCYALDPFLSTMKITAKHYAIGSGAAHALALMSAGMSAPQAIAHIVKHELADGVGGEVQTLSLRAKKGIRKR